MGFKNYREETKTNWGTHQGGSLSLDQINTGCLLRIADAIEVTAKNYVAMQSELERYKKYYDQQKEAIQRRDRSIAALRGHINRIKKQSI